MIHDAYYVSGKVAIRYYQPVPKFVNVGSKQYVFSCEHGVSLVLVDESEVPAMLEFRGGCCGHKQQVMSLANEATYKHWLDGGGGR